MDRHGQRGHGRFEEPELAAETPTDRHGGDGDLVVAQAQHTRHHRAGVEQRLGRGVNEQVAEGVDVHGARLGFQIRLRDPVRVVFAFDDDVSSSQTGGNVAAFEPRATRDIGLGRIVRARIAGGGGAVHGQLFLAQLTPVLLNRNAGGQRFDEIDRSRHVFVLDVDQVRGVFRGTLGFGENRHHGMSDVHHTVEREQDLAGLGCGFCIRNGQIASGEHGDDAGHL